MSITPDSHNVLFQCFLYIGPFLIKKILRVTPSPHNWKCCLWITLLSLVKRACKDALKCSKSGIVIDDRLCPHKWAGGGLGRVWSGIKNWGMSWAMMKSHYQRGQKILKDDLKERKKKVKNSWTTLKSSPLFYLDLFKNDNGNDSKKT